MLPDSTAHEDTCPWALLLSQLVGLVMRMMVAC